MGEHGMSKKEFFFPGATGVRVGRPQDAYYYPTHLCGRSPVASSDPRCSPMKTSSMERSRRWLFTVVVQDPAADEFAILVRKSNFIRFATWQMEKKSSIYIQGYIELLRPIRKSQMCSLFAGYYFQSAVRTSQVDCFNYLSQQPNIIRGPWSIGSKASPGTRTDLLSRKVMEIEPEGYMELFRTGAIKFIKTNSDIQERIPVKAKTTVVFRILNSSVRDSVKKEFLDLVDE